MLIESTYSEYKSLIDQVKKLPWKAHPIITNEHGAKSIGGEIGKIKLTFRWQDPDKDDDYEFMGARYTTTQDPYTNIDLVKKPKFDQNISETAYAALVLGWFRASLAKAKTLK